MIKFYGTEEQEILDAEPGETIQRLMDDVDCPDFPIRVFVYKRMSIAKDEETLAKDILDDIIERLDGDYGDPDGDYTEATENMKKASIEFAKVILSDYKSWACEKTGEVLEYSKEEAAKIAMR